MYCDFHFYLLCQKKKKIESSKRKTLTQELSKQFSTLVCTPSRDSLREPNLLMAVDIRWRSGIEMSREDKKKTF